MKRNKELVKVYLIAILKLLVGCVIICGIIYFFIKLLLYCVQIYQSLDRSSPYRKAINFVVTILILSIAWIIVIKRNNKARIKKEIIRPDSDIKSDSNTNIETPSERSVIYLSNSARIQSERSKMSKSLRYDVLNRDGHKCQICGRGVKDGVKLHVDHIKPVSKGGKTELDNLRTLCEDCNLGKRDKYDPDGDN